MPEQIFFAYPGSPPLVSETIEAAAQEIDRIGIVDCFTWKDLKTAGRVLLHKITDEIDRSALLAAEVTDLNPNVLFELGYAIAMEKRIWILLETSRSAAKTNWRDFGLLRGWGYSEYHNIEDLVKEFTSQTPHKEPTTPFDALMAPSVGPEQGPTLLYIPALHDTEPNRQLTRIAQNEQHHGVRVVVADYSESALYPFGWYAQELFAAEAVIIHFTSPERTGAIAYNARSAFVAGMAHGMNRNVLMLAEDPYAPPVDYENLLITYSTTKECRDLAEEWLQSSMKEARARASRTRDRTRRLGLATSLSKLRLGDHVAEHESDELASYFVETAPYRRTLEAQTLIFVGRKGAGKTANMLTAAEALSRDRRNIVCVIKPQSYELQAVARLFSAYREVDVRNYVAASLWRYLCVTEVAKVTAEMISARPAGALPETPEWQLVTHMENEGAVLAEDFAVRFERAVTELRALNLPQSVEGARDYINEALHQNHMRRLRELLTPVLTNYERVAVLIDNLDKAWEAGADLQHLSSMLFGLLTGSGRLSRDLVSGSADGQLQVSLAIFMRADIFREVSRLAREPDKMPVVQLAWEDPDLLLRLIDERYAASLDRPAEDDELWNRYFVPTVHGRPTKQYILSRILPRPRDLILFCNSAIFSAINARRERVTEVDIEAGARDYSQFAVGSLRVENGITLEQIDDVFLSLMGEPSILEENQIVQLLEEALPKEKVSATLDHLRSSSFLGTEVRNGDFRYVEHAGELPRVEALVKKFRKREGRGPRYEIHPAFRPYLEVEDAEP